MTNHTHEEERDDVIILTDEEGQEYEFQLIDVIEVDELRYAVLFPLEEDESSEDEALIMRLESDVETGEDLLVDIEDDDEWEKVVAEWERLLEEEDIDEEEDEEEK
jgi:uncharacterized protein YrzB (UPF0473 family)